jgi:hypothetical protein
MRERSESESREPRPREPREVRADAALDGHRALRFVKRSIAVLKKK